MTTGATEQTDGGESLELPPSFTTLSTIAIQAGQSQITISVLRVGKEITVNLHYLHAGVKKKNALRVSVELQGWFQMLASG